MKKNIIKTGLLAIMSVAAVSCIDLDTAPYDSCMPMPCRIMPIRR